MAPSSKYLINMRGELCTKKKKTLNRIEISRKKIINEFSATHKNKYILLQEIKLVREVLSRDISRHTFLKKAHSKDDISLVMT
jgi:hypothetical protein